MIFTVLCCTFMNHCNPDSSTKTHISSHTKHVFFKNSSLQKIHISSHPEHVFFHKGSHILSPKHAMFQRLFHRKLACLPTPLLSKTLPQNIHISSHTKHVFSITLLYRKFIHPLTQNMSFYMPSFTKVHISSHQTLTQNMPFCMPSFTRNHISSHQTHALFQWLFHTNFNSHTFPHKPCLLSKALPQKIHTSSHPTHVFLHVFFQ